MLVTNNTVFQLSASDNNNNKKRWQKQRSWAEC